MKLSELLNTDQAMDVFKGIILSSFDKEYLSTLHVSQSEEHYTMLANKLIKTGRVSLGLNDKEVADMSGIDIHTYMDMDNNPYAYDLRDFLNIFTRMIEYKDNLQNNK